MQTRNPWALAALMALMARLNSPGRPSSRSWVGARPSMWRLRVRRSERGSRARDFSSKYGIGAQINVLAAVHQFLQQLKDRGIEQGFAPGDGDYRGAAVLHGLEALFQGQGLSQGLPIFLDAAAALAGQIALVRGLQHQDQGKFLLPLEALLHEVTA